MYACYQLGPFLAGLGQVYILLHAILEVHIYASDQLGPCFSGSVKVLYSGACVHLISVVNLLLVLGRFLDYYK